MKLKVFKALWGMTGTLEEQFKRIAEAGYDGVEAGIPADDQFSTFQVLLKRHRLDFIAMAFTNGADHAASLNQSVEQALRLGACQITVHSAQSFWPLEKQHEYFARALDIEKRAGLPLNHETHRGRALFTPWHTATLLRAFTALHITADFSHFCCVCESLLAEHTDDMALCVKRARHIHGRVGHEEGPQVNDPRAPEWHTPLLAHEAWWKAIIAEHRKAGASHLTFTPEFGPPNYMPTLPYTCQPVSDLWDVCLFMAERFRTLFAEQREA
jgi:sugar phosphate isomerase/epimerase